MKVLSYGDKVAIVACSNGLDESMRITLCKLVQELESLGLVVETSKKIFKENSIFNGSNAEKAEILMDYYKDSSIKAIFDISGGDLANTVLDYIDFDIIEKNPKFFFGYSDLTVLINAIYKKTKVKSYLYQVRNLVGEYKEAQIRHFKDSILEDGNRLTDFDYEWIQGEERGMEGIVVGGNIRCLLKLAGTEYMIDFEDKILFLEAYSGDIGKMSTYLYQLRQLNAFHKIKGIILGTFTEMEMKDMKPSIVQLTKMIVDDENMPIVKTGDIGHGHDSKAILIGGQIKLN